MSAAGVVRRKNDSWGDEGRGRGEVVGMLPRVGAGVYDKCSVYSSGRGGKPGSV